MIYLGSPYKHELMEIQEARFKLSAIVAARLVKGGILVFSPLTHSHPINVAMGTGSDWSLWETFDLWMLSKCEELLVIRIPGWETSKGLFGEINFARSKSIPVNFLEPLPSELSAAGL